LAKDSGIATSELLGGQLAVDVRTPEEFPGADLTPDAMSIIRKPLIEGKFDLPQNISVGRIQSLEPEKAFPAVVSIPVFYSFLLGPTGSDLNNNPEVTSIVAEEPHAMEAVVNSIPPSPDICVRAREWNLVTTSNQTDPLWIKVDCFRFLGVGNWDQNERLTYEDQ
jgi:hypothetical protein